MALTWTVALSTGIEWQDNQHKDLFAKINDFIEAIERGTTDDDLLCLFDFLGNYTRTHFGQEEAAMETYGYPEYAAHKARHEIFIENLGRLREGMGRKTGVDQLTVQARKLLSDWFYDHVRKMDKHLGAFLVDRR